jgi:RNA-binding protein YhbY
MEMQIGKKGLTPEFLKEIKNRFEKTKNIKVSVLRSAREKREDVKKYAEEIKKNLGSKFTYRVLGFSIFFKKWRKPRE